MDRLVTMVTGPIVGLNSTDFLNETVSFASRLGLQIATFNLFDEILTLSGKQPSNRYEEDSMIGQILDGYQYQFQSLREEAYLSIARKISCLPRNTSVLVRTPASIEWRGVSNHLKDHRLIASALKPRRFVTLIDAEWKIKRRLTSKYGRHALRVIAHQKQLGIREILQWLGAEVSVTEDWAEWAGQLNGNPVQHLVLGIATPWLHNRKKYSHDVENLTKIATQQDLMSFYSSYSMTVAAEKVRREINKLIWRLRSYGVVIDPASIELGRHVKAADESVVFAYTVCRDLRWDVQKVNVVAAFHPYLKKPPLSTGMMDELGHARAFQKERYFVLPAGGASPFTKNNYVPAEHIFRTGDEFFDYLQHRRKPKLRPEFRHITKAFAQWQRKHVLSP